MTDHLTEADLDEFMHAFNVYTEGGDSTMPVSHLQRIMHALNLDIDDEDLQDIVSDIELDDASTSAYNDFRMKMHDTLPEAGDADYRVAFQEWTNGDADFINANDIGRVLSSWGLQLTDVEIHDLLRSSDLDGDGVINFNDFVELMKRS